jgi:hypothetical protein
LPAKWLCQMYNIPDIPSEAEVLSLCFLLLTVAFLIYLVFWRK